jgi:hypothetical protein
MGKYKYNFFIRFDIIESKFIVFEKTNGQNAFIVLVIYQDTILNLFSCDKNCDKPFIFNYYYMQLYSIYIMIL